MPSLPCELVYGSAPQTAGHLLFPPPPVQTRHWPSAPHLQSLLGPVLLRLHGSTPVFAPRPPMWQDQL